MQNSKLGLITPMSDSTPLASGTNADAAVTNRTQSVAPASKKLSKQFDRSAYGASSNRGYGKSTARGFELALTLCVMVGIGWLVDGFLGTQPVFTIIFSIVAFGGLGIKLWLGYDIEMREHEDGAIWNRNKTQKHAA